MLTILGRGEISDSNRATTYDVRAGIKFHRSLKDFKQLPRYAWDKRESSVGISLCVVQHSMVCAKVYTLLVKRGGWSPGRSIIMSCAALMSRLWSEATSLNELNMDMGDDRKDYVF